MRSRGPDGEGTWVCPSTGLATLGHRRLAILDPSHAGHQPMVTPEGLVAITYNGEVYNAPSLRRELESVGVRFVSRTDTEVVLHGFVRWGAADLLRRAQGMFAFAIWDARPTARGEPPILTVAADHAGMKPLYWNLSAGVLSVASTADALRDVMAERPDPDPVGLCHVLSLGYCPAPATVWRNVYKLGPAQCFEWSPGQDAPTVRSWWNPPEAPGTHGGDGPEPLNTLLTEVTREHLHADVPISLLLSGGIDSSALAAVMGRLDRATPCVTIGLSDSDDESHAAAQTAAHLGLKHHITRLDARSVSDLMRQVGEAFDEPQGFGALLTMIQAARAARQFGPVVLAGDGGDEAFGGYTWHRPRPRHAEAGPRASQSLIQRVTSPDADPAERAAALASLSSLGPVHEHLQNVMPRFHPAESQALLAPLCPEYNSDTYCSWLVPHHRPGLSAIRRRQRLDLFGFCPGSILPKLDRASMAFGLELRAPFLDRRVLEWSLALPESEAETRDENAKPLLRELLSGRVPAAVLSRPKQGFSLRVAMSDVLPSMLGRVEESGLVDDGILRHDWRCFVRTDAPNAHGRAFAICALAAWWEARS